MKTMVRTLSLAAASAVFTLSLLPQTAHAGGVEIAPFGAYRIGGQFDQPSSTASANAKAAVSYGLAIDVEYSQDQQVELFYSKQSTEAKNIAPTLDLDVEYLQIGGVANYPLERFTPFVIGTIGATRFAAGIDGYDHETRPSLTIGGGFKYFINEHFGLKLESRAYLTIFESETNMLCSNTGGGCLLRNSGQVLWQLEAGAGFIVKF